MGIEPEKADAEHVIGIDLGGTAIKLGRFDRHGYCLQSLIVPTPQPPHPEAVLQVILNAIAQLDPLSESLAIGIGTPGPADAAGRIARVAVNLAGWHDIPLADWIETKTGKPTILANDANCAGLGEFWLGAGRSFQDLVMLTLGTGVGGAVILNGKLFLGRGGAAGELGFITLNLEGAPCNSGNHGSLEQHISVQAIRRRTGLEPDELGRRAAAGDADAIAFWNTYGCELGAGLATLIYVLNPEAIIIGGGVSASAKFFFPAAQAELERRVLPCSRSGLQLLQATLGNQAGIVGAAQLAWQHLETHSNLPALSSATATTVTTEQELADLHAQLQQTQLAYQMATEMSQFKAGFLARASHELRSPVNSVLSLHQLILAGLCDSPEEEREFIAQAYSSAQKMLKLLDELISIARAEHGSSKPQIQPLQVAAALSEVEQLTHLQARNRSLRLEIERPEQDLYVLADPNWLRQILRILIDTPLTLMQDGTVRVTTHTSLDTGHAYIKIQDERPAETWSEPIDLLYRSSHEQQSQSLEQIKAAIATPDQQPSNKLSPSMSLAIVQTLMEKMNGRLELLATPSPHPEASKFTQIQCAIPLVIPELGLFEA